MSIKDLFRGIGKKSEEEAAPPDPNAWPTPDMLDQGWGQGTAAPDEGISWPVENDVGQTSGWDVTNGGWPDADASAGGWPSPDDAAAGGGWPSPGGAAAGGWPSPDDAAAGGDRGAPGAAGGEG